MATKKISDATNKTSLADTDMLPLAALGDSTAYKITGANLINSLPTASTSQKGLVELASAADIGAGTAGVAVEAATLKTAMAGTHGITLAVSPPTLATIDTAFSTAFGRGGGFGDIVVVQDSSGAEYLLAYAAAPGRRWAGFALAAGAFVSYS